MEVNHHHLFAWDSQTGRRESLIVKKKKKKKAAGMLWLDVGSLEISLGAYLAFCDGPELETRQKNREVGRYWWILTIWPDDLRGWGLASQPGCCRGYGSEFSCHEWSGRCLFVYSALQCGQEHRLASVLSHKWPQNIELWWEPYF